MIILEILSDIVFYNLGYWFLKLITIGKYPVKHETENGNIFVESVGFVVFVLILFLAAYLFF